MASSVISKGFFKNFTIGEQIICEMKANNPMNKIAKSVYSSINEKKIGNVPETLAIKVTPL